MKKLISTAALILSCASLIASGSAIAKGDANNSDQQSQNKTSLVTFTGQESSPETETEIQNNKNIKDNKKEGEKPQAGKVKELVNGDLMCYVTLVDKKGVEHNVGATFEICADDKKFVNKQVRVVYEIKSVSDCQSAEPCGKTRKESIITKMEVVNETSEKKSPSKSNNSQTLSNGEWTITIGNIDSWKGVNGTGNLTYKGCDSQSKCLSLTGGKVSCRDGKCLTGWKNSDYIYILEQPITEKGNSTATLIVRKGTTQILKVTKLKAVPSK